jgi:hypothetical protein
MVQLQHLAGRDRITSKWKVYEDLGRGVAVDSGFWGEIRCDLACDSDGKWSYRVVLSVVGDKEGKSVMDLRGNEFYSLNKIGDWDYSLFTLDTYVLVTLTGIAKIILPLYLNT